MRRAPEATPPSDKSPRLLHLGRHPLRSIGLAIAAAAFLTQGAIGAAPQPAPQPDDAPTRIPGRAPADPTRAVTMTASTQPQGRSEVELRLDAIFGPVPTDAPRVVEMEIPAPGFWSITLASGVTVHLMPMPQTTLVCINAALYDNAGSIATEEDAKAAQLFAGVLDQPAIGGFDWNSVMRALAGQGVRSEGFTMHDGISIEVQTRPESASTALRLIRGIIEAPSIDEAALQRWRLINARQTQARAQRADRALDDEFRRALAGSGVTPKTPMPPGALDTVSNEAVRAWAARHNATASIEIGIAGPFEVEEMIELCRLVFGAIPPRPPVAPREAQAPIREPIDHAIAMETTDQRDLLISGFTVHAQGLDFTTRTELSVLSMILRQRVESALKGDPTVFGVSAGAILEDVSPVNGAIAVYLPLARGKTDAVHARIESITSTLMDRPVSEEELTPAIDTLVDIANRRINAPVYWTGRILNSAVRAERDIQQHRREIEILRAVTGERILALAREFIPKGLPIRVQIETFGSPPDLGTGAAPREVFDPPSPPGP